MLKNYFLFIGFVYKKLYTADMTHLNFILFFTLFFSVICSHSALPDRIYTQDLMTQKKLQLNLASADKKGTVYVFMSAKCPCSNSHIPLLKKLAAEFADFQFYAVHSNLDEKNSDAVKYFKSVNLPFQILKDEETKLADTFQAFKTPHAFLVNAKGEIMYQGGVTNSSHADSADRQYLKEALLDVRAGKDVKTPEGRTLGCVIMRRDELPQ